MHFLYTALNKEDEVRLKGTYGYEPEPLLSGLLPGTLTEMYRWKVWADTTVLELRSTCGQRSSVGMCNTHVVCQSPHVPWRQQFCWFLAPGRVLKDCLNGCYNGNQVRRINDQRVTTRVCSSPSPQRMDWRPSSVYWLQTFDALITAFCCSVRFVIQDEKRRRWRIAALQPALHRLRAHKPSFSMGPISLCPATPINTQISRIQHSHDGWSQDDPHIARLLLVSFASKEHAVLFFSLNRLRIFDSFKRSVLFPSLTSENVIYTTFNN